MTATAKITFEIDLDTGVIINHKPDELVSYGLSVVQNMRRACAINALYGSRYDFEKDMYDEFLDAGFEKEDFDKPVWDSVALNDMLDAYSKGEDLESFVDCYYGREEKE